MRKKSIQMNHIKKFNESVTNSKMYIVSSYIDGNIPDKHTLIGDKETTEKEYLRLLDDMNRGYESKPFIIILAEILNFPISLQYVSGIEINNTKTIRIAYNNDSNHNLNFYGIPKNIKNDFKNNF